VRIESRDANEFVLEYEDFRLALAPAAGGCIAGFSALRGGRRLELLRPALPGAIDQGDPLGMACFPLVPFSGRIRGGRFYFGGRAIRLPPNLPPEPHNIHGHGWRAPWSIAGATGSSAVLEFRHTADDWPWSYRATQAFDLGAQGLAIEMTVTNEGDEPMPAGLGEHPYFVRTPRATVTAAVDGLWVDEAGSMATEGPDRTAEELLRRGLRPAETAIDMSFFGWRRRAVVDWPEWRARVTIEAEAPLDFLVVYTPVREDYFCVEPVSNGSDAFNLAVAGRTDTGTRVLAPGETLRARIRLVPEID
jgi:aldose 1-epimerase